ncbi:Tryptophan synthase alpha chain [hydrothermal vent metagenome]|uniref:tryptophan synthase n=1 Tax=hydrothermal vent metagenome TaxID=652676 RepID=A0A3B1CLS3_9ZZZZ
MSRIQSCFQTLKEKSQKALVAFITAGDPDLPTTGKIFSIIEKSGADIIELGVPFSDPLADGPVIQAASQRALENGTTLKKIIQLVAEIRKGSELPIVLMTSYNPVFAYGQKQFVDDALNAGVDGVIIPDLPPEEAGDFDGHAKKQGLDMIHLLAPTSTEDRIRLIADESRGFIYYVSLTGTTGVKTQVSDNLEAKVQAIKKVAELPVLVGFGISGPDQAQKAAAVSDGVIVGSAIVRLIEQNSNSADMEAKVGDFVASVKQAISNPG